MSFTLEMVFCNISTLCEVELCLCGKSLEYEVHTEVSKTAILQDFAKPKAGIFRKNECIYHPI